MCNVISNRLIIGNYLIKLVEQDKYDFTLEEFKQFDDVLTPKLKKIDYYSSFDSEGIMEFVEEYPYLVSYHSDSFSITRKMNRELLNQILENYFYSGLTKPITDVINEAFNIYWDNCLKSISVSRKEISNET